MDTYGEREIDLRGIRGRLVGTYLVITLLAVAVFEVILIYSLIQFYYTSIEAELNRSAQTIIRNYGEYLNNYDLNKDAKVLIESIPGNTVAQVQVISNKKFLLADSIDPASVGYQLDYPDITSALKGKSSAWRGQIPLTYEPILSVSSPVTRDGEVIGVVRVITTLSDVNEILQSHIIILIVLGINIVLMIFLTGLFLSSTIIRPVKEITSAAAEMAQGKFDVRVARRYDDEVGKLADTLNYMAQEVSNHQRMKNDFIASVSHELLTPLTSIKGWILTLNSGDIDNKEEIREGLSIIEKESDRLTSLVKELLDFSKFAAGAITLRKDIVDLNEFLRNIKRQMEPRAERKSVNINMDIDEGIPNINADENRLKQVLINILDNSFKFTPEGGNITIIAKALKNEVLIRIEDTGCGIPEGNLPKVTQRFYKGSSGAVGSGLGLSICEEIIRLHEGRINIESTVGKGTVVEIFLPV